MTAAVEVLEEKRTGSEILNLHGLPVAPHIMFSDHKDRHKKGIEKRQAKLVGKISFLKPFLKDDEVIFLVTRGCSPTSMAEQFLMGWVVFYLKRSLFVFTNKRIFHVPTNMDYSYRNSITHFRYGDCEDISMKGRSLLVRYESGKKERFLYMDGKERKKVKALLNVIPLKGETSPTEERTHLCPRCTEELVELVPACPNCGLEFLTKAEGRTISIVYPGGGFFYTRHPVLGILDALSELYLIYFAAIFAAEAVRGDTYAVVPFVIFGVLIFFEKVFTIYHTNNFLAEFLPKEKKIH